MAHKTNTKKVISLTLIIISILASGCNINNDDNGVRQQGTRDNQQRIETQRQEPNGRPDNTNDRIEVADQAADKIVGITGVRQANVLVTQRNAYVAATLDDNRDQLSRQIEDQIAQQVRKTDPTIQNVYVSTNPDFVDRINGYVNDVQQGRPVAGFFEEFNEMVQRMFPNAR